MSRRLLPAAIAALVLAIVATGWWFLTRPASISTTLPKSAPAAGSCWTVNVTEVGAQLPWKAATSAPCTAAHTAEVFYVGQVDTNLIKNARSATGDSKDVANLVIIASARAACLAHASDYLAGSFRNARLAVYPDFVAPAGDGFYACVAAEVTGPDAAGLVTRQASLKGALAGTEALKIDCVRTDSTLVYVPCAQPHTSEFVGLYTVTPLGAPFNQPAVAKNVQDGCTALVDQWLGLQPGQTRTDLQVREVGPESAAVWVGSDQTFACYATAAQPWTGSIKGLGTRALTR